MKFIVEFDTDNAAFGEGDPEDRATETARILHDVIERVENGAHMGQVRDINGNRVGEFMFIDESLEGDMP